MFRAAIPCCFASFRREWKTRWLPSAVQDGIALDPVLTIARAVPSSATLRLPAARTQSTSATFVRPVMAARLSGRDGFAIVLPGRPDRLDRVAPRIFLRLVRGRGGRSRPCRWGPTTALLHRVTFSADHPEARLAAGLLLLLSEPPAVVFRRPRHVTFVHNVVALEDGRGPHARHLHNRVVRLSSPPQIAHGAPTEVME